MILQTYLTKQTFSHFALKSMEKWETIKSLEFNLNYTTELEKNRSYFNLIFNFKTLGR